VTLNNQSAFDSAVLHLLNQGHRCVSSAGRAQLRGPRGGKSAIGALIPDRLYSNSMEGKTIQQLLAASGREYLPLREHLAGVAPQLLGELQELHDRTGNCMPSLFREIVVDGGHRIARMFRLSMRLPQLCTAYQRLRGPYLPAYVPPYVPPAPIPVLESPITALPKPETVSVVPLTLESLFA
jgi:hypothetical protein